MNVRRILSSISIPLAILLLDGTAAAQDLAAAEALFNKGVAEMEAGRFDVACPAIAESQRLDPRPGTLFTLADCHEKAGKIATAVAVYEDYLRAVGQMSQAYKLRHNDRAKIATARKAALAAEIPELTLTLPASAPKDVKITRDGVEFTAASLGIGLPLDPGEHVLTTQVGSGPAHEQRITLGRAEKKTLELQIKHADETPVTTPSAALQAPPPMVPATAPPHPRTPAAPPSAEVRPTGEQGLSSRQAAALAAGGLGVAGIAVGALAGALTLSSGAVVREHCDGAVCDAEGKSAADRGKTTGLISSIGFGVGAAGAAAGLGLLLSAAPEERAVGGRAAGALVAGGVGVAGIAVGALAGALTLAERSIVKERCEGATCDPEGKAAADRGKTTGLVSTIGFGVGAAGLAAAVGLALTGGPAPAAGGGPKVKVGLLGVGPDGAAVGARGAW